MIYKRPVRLNRRKSNKIALRNFGLILLVIFLAMGGYLLFNKIIYAPNTAVIKYRVKAGAGPVASNNPDRMKSKNESSGSGVTGSSGGGGGGGEEDDKPKHTEIFVFSEADASNRTRHDIFIYDSAKDEKKRLTEPKTDKIRRKTKFNINPKFSSDGKKIYFLTAFGSFYEICSMDLDGGNVATIVAVGKTNFSVSGTTIIYIGTDKNIWTYETVTKTLTNLKSPVFQHDLDFPLLSKDGKHFYFVSKSSGEAYDVHRYNLNDYKDSEQNILFTVTSSRIISIELSPDDKYLLITFGTNVFKIFDVTKERFIHAITSDKGSRITGATWSEDSKSVYWIRDSPHKNVAKLSLEKIKDGMSSDVIIPNFSGYFLALKPTAEAATGGGAIEQETFIYAAKSSPMDTNTLIFTHTPSTKTKIQLTGTEKDPNAKEIFWDFEPKYSPDGKTIAFCRVKQDSSAEKWIHSMKNDGSDLTKLVRVNDCRNFSFSPDSQALNYISWENHVHIRDLKTGNDRPITFFFDLNMNFPVQIKDPETGTDFIYYFIDRGHSIGSHLNRTSLDGHKTELVYNGRILNLQSCALSPDSSKLLLSTSDSGTTFILDLKTKVLTKSPITNNSNKPSVFWSNDSEFVYFYLAPVNQLVKFDTEKFDDKNMIIVMEKLPIIHGISLKPLNPNSSTSGASKNTETLLYIETRGTNKIIVSHDLRTGIKINLSGETDEIKDLMFLEDDSPKMSPDREILAFCRKIGTKFSFSYGLYYMNPDGSNVKILRDISFNNCDFSFTQDGEELIYKQNDGYIASVDLIKGGSSYYGEFGSRPTMSSDRKYLYVIDQKTLYRKNWTLPVSDSSFLKTIHTFEAVLQDFRLSPDDKYAAVLYSNIVTIISLDHSKVFTPIVDGKSPIKDAIWSQDGKWLYIRRSDPSKDLIKISTSDFDLSSAEIVLENFAPDSTTQIISNV